MARKDPCDFIRRRSRASPENGRAGPAGVLESALQASRTRSRDVRVQAARLLGEFQDVKSILPLLKAMADSHWSVRESAEIALLNFGTDAADLSD